MQKKTKKGKKGMKLLVSYIVLFAVGVLAVGTIGVAAYEGAANTVMENVTIQNYNAGNGELGGGDMLGGANRPIHMVFDYVNGLYVSGDQIFDSSANATLPGTLSVTGITTLTANLIVDTNSLLVDATNNKVGVVSSTPFGQLSVGTGGTVSSTISMGKFCMYAGQENGTRVYLILGANQAANQPFATTTVSCF